MPLIQITILGSDGSEFGEENHLQSVIDTDCIESFYETIESGYCNVTMKSGDTFGVEINLEDFIAYCGFNVQ